MKNMTDTDLLKVAEVAPLLRLSCPTVYRMIRNGDIPAVRFGRGTIRVDRRALEAEFAQARRVQP